MFTDYRCKFCSRVIRIFDPGLRGWCSKASCKAGNGVLITLPDQTVVASDAKMEVLRKGSWDARIEIQLKEQNV